MEKRNSLDTLISNMSPIVLVFSIIFIAVVQIWSPSDFPGMEGVAQKIWATEWAAWFTFFISGLITTCQFIYRGPDIKSKGN